MSRDVRLATLSLLTLALVLLPVSAQASPLAPGGAWWGDLGSFVESLWVKAWSTLGGDLARAVQVFAKDGPHCDPNGGSCSQGG